MALPTPTMSPLAISFDDIAAAVSRLAGVAHRTPVLCSATADARTGAQLFFKCENLQRMGAFKFRGACNALARFTPAQRRAGVIAYSSGNHAQAIALAARLLDMPSVIVMPQDAPPAKLAATRGYQAGRAGSEVVLYDRYTEDREAIGQRLAEQRGMTLIPPYDHADVMAGQGTAALELVQQVRERDGGGLDLLLVCVGGGGLISGCAVAAKHLLPDVQVWGVEPEAGDDTRQSLARGEIVHIPTPHTIADGAQTQHSGRLTFPVIQALVSGIVTVSDAELVQAMRFFAERMKLVVEPTGALGAAAAFCRSGQDHGGGGGLPDLRGRRVGVIVSGGNVDLARYAALLGGGDGGGGAAEAASASAAT
jgi:threonine dehydratase